MGYVGVGRRAIAMIDRRQAHEDNRIEMRPWCSGNTAASQASDVGSIPIGRSFRPLWVVITQGKKISKPITGSVKLSFKDKNGKHLGQIVSSDHKLKLRHVQVLEGQIKLTDDISPNTITVTLKQKNKKDLSRDFGWQLSSSPL